MFPGLDTCTIGSWDFTSTDSDYLREPPTTDTLHGLLLNMDQPATCNGTAIAWQYCFYVTAWSDEEQKIEFAVYRPSTDIGLRYFSLEESVVELQIDTDDYASGLNCKGVEIITPFTVLEGDIVGACLPSSDSPVNITPYYSPNSIYSIEQCKQVDSDAAVNPINKVMLLHLVVSGKSEQYS